MTARIRIVIEEPRGEGFEEREDHVIDVPDEIDAYQLAAELRQSAWDQLRIVRSLMAIGGRR